MINEISGMDKILFLVGVVLLASSQANSENSDDALIANVFQTGGGGGFNPAEGGCKCIPFYLCQNETQLKDGSGLINYRLITPKCNCECQSYTDRCCYVPPNTSPKDDVSATPITDVSTSTVSQTDKDLTTTKPKVSTSKPTVTTARPSVTTHNPKPKTSTARPKTKRKPKCGMRRVDLFETRIMGSKNRTKSSEFPWMVAIFHVEEHNGESAKRFMCAGSLIHERVVMTVAHCAKLLITEKTILRAGAWDLNSNEEVYPHQDRVVSQVITHDSFSSRYVTNDIALLVTTTPFKFALNVDVLCLAKPEDVVSDESCIGSGWGRNETGEAPQESKTEKPPNTSTNDRSKTIRPYVLDFDFGGGVNYHFERHAGGIRDVFRVNIDPFGTNLWSPSVISVASERSNPSPKQPPPSQPSQPNPTGKYNASAFQHGMKYVELPTVPRDDCESKLQETRLGPYFTLHESVMCAGGTQGKDTCQGDGGSPLICPIRGQKDRYQQVGIVAGGIGCGTGIPGLYANVAFLRPWIDQHLTQLGFTPAYDY